MGTEVLSQVGRRTWLALLICPGVRGFWFSSRDSEAESGGSGVERKSENDGPELSLSVKAVGFLEGLLVMGVGDGVVAYVLLLLLPLLEGCKRVTA